MTQETRDVVDVVAVFGAFGSLFQIIPDIAALLAAVWTAIRIYEWVRVRIFKKPPRKDLHL